MRRLLWWAAFPIDRDLSLTREEKTKVWRRAEAIRSPRYGREYLWIFCIEMFAWSLSTFLRGTPGTLRTVLISGGIVFLTLIPINALIILGLAWFSRKNNHPMLHQALHECDIDSCRQCGYWLKGLHPSDIKRCPECGHSREPTTPDSKPPDSRPPEFRSPP